MGCLRVNLRDIYMGKQMSKVTGEFELLKAMT